MPVVIIPPSTDTPPAGMTDDGSGSTRYFSTGGSQMAETGLTSAIGLAIESYFRETPITVATGINYNVGITGNNPHRFFTVEPGGGLIAKPEVQVPDNEIDGQVETTRTMLVSKSYNGNYSFKGDAENMYYPLLGMFGRDVQTAVQTAGTVITPSMFQHVFTPNKYAPSFTAEEIFGAANYGRLSGGTVIQRLTITFGKVITCQMELIPYRQVPNTYLNASNAMTDYGFGATAAVIPPQMSTLADGANTWTRTASPTYVDVEQDQGTTPGTNGPFVFAKVVYGLQGGNFAAAFMTVDGTAVQVELLEGFTVVLERKIDSSMIAGSGFDPGACTGSQWTVGGKFNILYKDTVIQAAALRHSKLAMNFQVLGLIPGTGTHAFALDVFIPNMRITSPVGPDVNDGPIMVGGDWRARRNPSSGWGVQVTLINTYDNTQLGGQFPLNQTITAPTVTSAATATLTSAKNVVKGDVHTFTNGATVEPKTVLSVNYTTNVVTYTANFANVFGTSGTVVTRNAVGGLGGWSNA